jgi:tetratricopeptide (TPR) repeat protein
MLRKAARILLYCDLGRKAEARQELEALPIQDFMVPLGGGEASLLGVGLLAQACATLAATHHAATLYDMLQPYAGRTILSGGIGSYICLGAVSRYLGLLAATLSRWQEAEAHFRDALALNTRMGARPYVARTQQDYASMLLARNQSGDRERARDLLTSALATAQELGMAELEEKVKSQQLKGQAEGFRLKASGMPPSAPYSLQPIACVLPQPSTPNLCRHDGEYWTLAYQGQVCHLKHAKGLQYIATLLRHPGQEFHVLDLEMMSEVQPTSPTARSRSESAESPATLRARARPTNTGPVLDAQATALYKQRLAELREERAEAQQFNDLARLEKVQTEIDFLTNELAGAYGLGGRARKGADPTERVRKTVTNNIRNSLAKIHAAHPPLWRHLLAALKTGAFCSYLPPQPISWEG